MVEILKPLFGVCAGVTGVGQGGWFRPGVWVRRGGCGAPQQGWGRGKYELGLVPGENDDDELEVSYGVVNYRVNVTVG